jgi:hypothetical protein
MKVVLEKGEFMSECKYGSLREKIAAEGKARKARYAEFEAVYNEANRAGFAAAEAMKPRAMVVASHSNPLDDSSPVEKAWYVADGVCGFAWVTIYPGNSSFAKWAVKNGVAKKAYRGGVSIWISAHNQSMERKEAHARKLADVLREKLGVKAYAESRMD